MREERRRPARLHADYSARHATGELAGAGVLKTLSPLGAYIECGDAVPPIDATVQARVSFGAGQVVQLAGRVRWCGAKGFGFELDGTPQEVLELLELLGPGVPFPSCG